MKYEAVMGIEVHCELKTMTKMFSGAPLGYGADANTAVNEIDLALPGTLPQLNGQAVQDAVLLAQALEMELDTLIRFDRKNYYYSDLPKGYQITQQFYPLGRHGLFKIMVDDELMAVRINRLHMEEDTAKQFHEGETTLIDFNRAGTPLLEIVTEADFRTAQQAAAYVDALRLVVIYLGISDGRMDEGSLRCDINISLREEGTTNFGTKVEIKNLNSINNIQKAIDHEIQRQQELLDAGQVVLGETRRFDEKTQTTMAMRSKETSVDYRYVAEPNIPPTEIPPSYLEQPLIELPLARQQRYRTDLGLSAYDAGVLIKNPELVNYFETLITQSKHYKLLVNWLTQDVLGVYDQKGDRSMEAWLPIADFVSFIEAIASNQINSKQAKVVFAKLLEGQDPQTTIQKEGMVQISDETTILGWIEAVLDEHPQVVEDYKKGLDKSIKFVVGHVMKVSGGKANPRLTQELVVRTLANR